MTMDISNRGLCMTPGFSAAIELTNTSWVSSANPLVEYSEGSVSAGKLLPLQ